jgi:phytoene desaturase
MKPVIVIGAGIGGLSAAIHLALAGKRVIIFEQNTQVGGKMGEILLDGFRWDTGPSVVTMRHVFETLFENAGRRLEDYLTLEPVEPLTRYFYPDGFVIDATRDLPRMAQQIACLDEKDVEGYLAYLAYAARIHRITGPIFIYDRPPTWRSFLRVPPRDYLKVDPMRTMQAAIEQHVRTPHLRQLLGRFATYVGASPFLAPATLNVIAHVELNGGVWYPLGGLYAIARAFARLASELGVEILTGCPIESILLDHDRVEGVQLEGGESISAEAVVANVDVSSVYSRLLPKIYLSRSHVKRLVRSETSCSGFILLLGVQGEHDKLAHHNIFFSRDYQREFTEIFRQGTPPSEPTIYLAITSKTEPDHAPAGCENWFLLVNAPAISDSFDWQKQGSDYRDLILQHLAENGLDIRNSIRVERWLTPNDLERQTGARRGALYGRSSNERLAAFQRPPNRSVDLRGLYFAGGTTHPGGGVPMVVLSGRVAAQMVLEDFS